MLLPATAARSGRSVSRSHLRVDRRRLQHPVPEHLPNRREIGAAGEHLGRERVPQPMRVHPPEPRTSAHTDPPSAAPTQQRSPPSNHQADRATSNEGLVRTSVASCPPASAPATALSRPQRHQHRCLQRLLTQTSDNQRVQITRSIRMSGLSVLAHTILIGVTAAVIAMEPSCRYPAYYSCCRSAAGSRRADRRRRSARFARTRRRG